jgi:choline dehydrogenase-like flavoprotein
LQRSSSDDWKDGLGNAGGWVGKGLVTHPYFFFETTLRENPLHLQPEMGFPTLVSRHYDSEAEQELGKFVLVNPPTSPVVDLARLMRSGKSADEIMKAVSGPIVVQTQGMVEVFPDKHNQVSNARGRNRFGLPQTRVDYVPDGRFNVRMNYIQSKVAEIHIAMGGGPTTMKATSWRADHAACTTRMSQDPGEGVVDLNLRVHGTENVYVCSNASFSTLGSVNPTLTLTALALRLGDHLLAGRGQVRGEAKVFLSALEESARQHFLQHL